MFDDPRWNDDPRDHRDDDWQDRRDDDGRTLGRGPGSNSGRDDHSEDNPSNRHDESRGLERDRDSRDRGEVLDPRDVFSRDLELPCGPDREIIHDARDREYSLRGSESGTLVTVGAFRVVSARDLRDHNDRPADPRSGDLRHLREEGLIRTERLDGHRDVAVVLTKSGRDLLESSRRVYPAYLAEAERLIEQGARIDHIVLDYELKREYQQWLHERDRDDAGGRPDREPQEIEEWAHEHDLPYFDEQVHFPDLRIEYEHPDGRWDHQDVEVITVHYRGSHGAAATRSGFSCYRGGSARLGGGGGGSRSGGRSANPHLAEEFLD